MTAMLRSTDHTTDATGLRNNPQFVRLDPLVYGAVMLGQ